MRANIKSNEFGSRYSLFCIKTFTQAVNFNDLLIYNNNIIIRSIICYEMISNDFFFFFIVKLKTYIFIKINVLNIIPDQY